MAGSKACIFTLSLLFFAGFAWHSAEQAQGQQSPTVVTATTPTPMPSAMAPPVPTQSPEVIELRAQTAEMRRSEDRIFQVFATALGLLIAVNVIGYLILNRNYDRDRRAIKQEVLGEVVLLVGIENKKALDARYDLRKELTDTLEKETRERNEQHAAVKKSLSTHSKYMMTVSNTAMIAHSAIRELRQSIWKIEAQRHVDRGEPRQALFYHLIIANNDIESKEPWSAFYQLDGIRNGLEAVDTEDAFSDLKDHERKALQKFIETYEPTDEQGRFQKGKIIDLVEEIDAKRAARIEEFDGMWRLPTISPTATLRPSNRGVGRRTAIRRTKNRPASKSTPPET